MSTKIKIQQNAVKFIQMAINNFESYYRKEKEEILFTPEISNRKWLLFINGERCIEQPIAEQHKSNEKPKSPKKLLFNFSFHAFFCSSPQFFAVVVFVFNLHV